jgi:ABC-type multidrug transport system, ATPase and permease components
MAIVGKNGAGKTTFIKLLCRLYDPTEGEILLNGINIKKYDYEEYLRVFSVVFQDFKLFSFSVAENVATSCEYDEDKLWKCLEQAGIKDRIEKLPEGINTNIYNNQEEGIEISGGEAQKLAIARALYKDAPVVILDEPTSALDPVSELEIYERFNKLVEEKTSIFISHRMSSCRFCNNILVFDDGQIVQIGNHDELVSDKEGIYHSLWEAQAKYYV